METKDSGTFNKNEIDLLWNESYVVLISKKTKKISVRLKEHLKCTVRSKELTVLMYALIIFQTL